MIPPVTVGLFGRGKALKVSLESLRSSSFTINEISSTESLSAFIASHAANEGRVLVASARDFPDNSAADVMQSGVRDKSFRSVTLESDETHAKLTSMFDEAILLPAGAGDAAVVEVIRRTAEGLFSQMEHSWSKNVVNEIRDTYEELYVAEPEIRNRPKKLLHRVRDLLNANLLSVYFRNSEQQYYSLELNVGSQTPRELAESNLASLPFSPKCETRSFSNRTTWPAFVNHFSPPASVNSIVLTTFWIEELTGVIVYGFTTPESCQALWDVCHFASREIFHSIRGTRIRSQHEVLRAIRPVPEARLDRDEAIWAALQLIRHHFGADGASLVELLQKDTGAYTFRKTYVHHDRQESETFTADHGYAVEVISKNQALLISRIVKDASPATAHGFAYDVDAMESGKGKPVSIPYFRTTRTIEDESSLMYIPLIVRNEIMAALKVGDFQRTRAFDLRHLIELRTLSAPVESMLIHMRLAEELRTRASNVAFHERIGQQAETLFFYREIALGVFHQLANHIRTLRSTLALMEIQLAREPLQRDEMEVNLKDAASSSELALDLISDAHKRGLTLKPIPKESFLVRDVVRPAIDYAKERVRGSEIIVKQTLTDRDYEVVLDPKLAKEGIINLLTNAIWAVKEHKHGGKKEIFIGVREEPPGFARIEISDSGVGMDRDTFEQVAEFAPFVTFRRGGTGLGLYFTQRLLEVFGGKISFIRSQPLKGTTVAVTIRFSSVSKGQTHDKNG